MTSWFGFHSTNLNAPVPTGCFPNSSPHFSTAFGLAMPKLKIPRFARNGAWGCLRVTRTVAVPTASTLVTIDLSSKPSNWPSQYSKVWPAFTWFSCWGCFSFHQRSMFHTTAAASHGSPSWNFTPFRSSSVQTLPSADADHFSASAAWISVVEPLYLTRGS